MNIPEAVNENLVLFRTFNLEQKLGFSINNFTPDEL